MKLKMFAVYDSKAEAYMQPFFMQSRGQAIRAWDGLVNDAKSEMCQYPADFTLFELGEYDDSNGQVEMLDAKINLGCAIEFKKKPADTLPLFPAKEGN